MSNTAILIGLLGSVVTLGLFVAVLIFRAGAQHARLEALEKWRDSIRIDMHEISDKLGALQVQLANLTALIEERTERRNFERIK